MKGISEQLLQFKDTSENYCTELHSIIYAAHKKIVNYVRIDMDQVGKVVEEYWNAYELNYYKYVDSYNILLENVMNSIYFRKVIAMRPLSNNDYNTFYDLINESFPAILNLQEMFIDCSMDMQESEKLPKCLLKSKKQEEECGNYTTRIKLEFETLLINLKSKSDIVDSLEFIYHYVSKVKACFSQYEKDLQNARGALKASKTDLDNLSAYLIKVYVVPNPQDMRLLEEYANIIKGFLSHYAQNQINKKDLYYAVNDTITGAIQTLIDTASSRIINEFINKHVTRLRNAETEMVQILMSVFTQLANVEDYFETMALEPTVRKLQFLHKPELVLKTSSLVRFALADGQIHQAWPTSISLQKFVTTLAEKYAYTVIQGFYKVLFEDLEKLRSDIGINNGKIAEAMNTLRTDLNTFNQQIQLKNEYFK